MSLQHNGQTCILIAETDLPFLDEMKRALEQAGHVVIVATDGMEAWNYLTHAAPPDLLVTRCYLRAGMPPGTALGLCAQTCKPRIPVVYIPESAEAAEYADPQHGAVLIKPFPVAKLVKTVRQIFEKVPGAERPLR